MAWNVIGRYVNMNSGNVKSARIFFGVVVWILSHSVIVVISPMMNSRPNTPIRSCPSESQNSPRPSPAIRQTKNFTSSTTIIAALRIKAGMMFRLISSAEKLPFTAVPISFAP